MIKLGALRDINKNNTNVKNWCIVRSMKTIPDGAYQIIDLSPSKELFFDFLAAKKSGLFNQEWFDEIYVPRFLKEMAQNTNSRYLLNRLYKAGKEKDFLLTCFCQDETICHRSIIGGMLLGAGAAIECNSGYEKYYEIYRNIKNSV